MDPGPPGPSVHGILQARTLEWAAIFFFRGPSPPRDRIHVSAVSCTGRRILYHRATWEACFVTNHSKLQQSSISLVHAPCGQGSVETPHPCCTHHRLAHWGPSSRMAYPCGRQSSWGASCLSLSTAWRRSPHSAVVRFEE